MGVTPAPRRRAGEVGVLGGAFDPPHIGHVEVARAAITHFGLERLLVRVVAAPGHKHVGTDAATRLRLAELAFVPLAGVEVAPDPHPRTIDSLRELALDDPVFLIGADEFASFATWKDPDGVLELARLGVATRPGVADDVQQSVLAGLRRPERVEFFSIAPQTVSSTEIRRLVGQGSPIAGLVPAAVEAEISRLGLYVDAGAR
jgi:nicotinate-nucleotide adenylyltransferase